MRLRKARTIRRCSKPKVAAAAHARIDHGDLTALLFAQGITRNEFVEG
jgi:phosphoserine phosphatase